MDFFDQRCEEIFRILEFNLADIICLQEVTPAFLEKLKNEKWVQTYYWISHIGNESSIHPYGCIILSTLHPTGIRRIPFPSFMNRDCIVADFLVNGEEIAFCTTHLESMHNPQKRTEQLRVISTQVAPYFSNLVLLGDFNFDSSQNFSQVLQKREALKKGFPIENIEDYPTETSEYLENDQLKTLLCDFCDIWVDCGLKETTDKGYTYDSLKNNMIKNYERMRYDRIMYKSNKKVWQPSGISLLGTQTIDPAKVGGTLVYPSDHFGLIVTLKPHPEHFNPS
uniref:Endonuclease/exonuclease/phosphatase domain-containing protein n=1 Tax=Arcella intermedia TaxID=1963864 RepID=A0A6B2LBW6_9EUKA